MKEATGYEIYRAASKKGTYKKIKTISKASTVKYSNTKLKKKATYYYKIRAYKKISGGKVYSTYSTIKSVKVK